jgi:hypothetical protein
VCVDGAYAEWHGYLRAWLLTCVITYVHGYLRAWLFTCMVTYVHGYLRAWLFSCMITYVHSYKRSPQTVNSIYLQRLSNCTKFQNVGWLVAGYPPRRPGFELWKVYVGFVAY